MKTTRLVALTSIPLALGLALTGCALPGNVLLGTAPLSSGNETSTEILRSASLKGSRMCIINNSSLPMSVLWRGYPDSRDIPIGGRHCNSGWEPSSDRTDIEGSIAYVAFGETGRVRYIQVSAMNQGLYWPQAQAEFFVPGGGRGGACARFSVGQMEFIDTGYLHGELTRLEDSDDNKEYELTLTDRIGAPGGNCWTGFQ